MCDLIQVGERPRGLSRESAASHASLSWSIALPASISHRHVRLSVNSSLDANESVWSTKVKQEILGISLSILRILKFYTVKARSIRVIDANYCDLFHRWRETPYDIARKG